VILRPAAVALFALAAWPVQAEAQIHRYVDANGTIVLSNARIERAIDVHAVVGAPRYVTTTALAAPAAATAYESLVLEHAKSQSLRPELVRAVIQVESGFNPRALSPKGAIGLMQLMPATARDLGVRDAWDPSENIRGGTLYLRQLLDRYDGNEELALAAYNAGAGAVDAHGGIPPYRETRDYVQKVGKAAGRKPAVSLAGGKTIFYKWIAVENGRAQIHVSTERPPRDVTFDVIER
jgi:soluble lytic murein transglycosylase-like protein